MAECSSFEQNIMLNWVWHAVYGFVVLVSRFMSSRAKPTITFEARFEGYKMFGQQDSCTRACKLQIIHMYHHHHQVRIYTFSTVSWHLLPRQNVTILAINNSIALHSTEVQCYASIDNSCTSRIVSRPCLKGTEPLLKPRSPSPMASV